MMNLKTKTKGKMKMVLYDKAHVYIYSFGEGFGLLTCSFNLSILNNDDSLVFFFLVFEDTL